MVYVADEYIDLEEVLSKCFMLAFKSKIQCKCRKTARPSNWLGQLACWESEQSNGPGADKKVMITGPSNKYVYPRQNKPSDLMLN